MSDDAPPYAWPSVAGGSAAVLSRVGGSGLLQEASMLPAQRYSDAQLIGVGGMGRVFSVFDHHLQRRVAMKEAAVGQLEPSALEQLLLHEARLAAALDHPGILPIHDVGYTPDGRLFYTMPIVSGATLADTLRDAGQAAGDASERATLVRRMLEACEAVAAAHRQGILHRDLKPANIMVDREGGTRVLDWGLAKRITADMPAPAMNAGPRPAAGTPQYMAPEQRAGRSLDARADVYSLGAILCEIATHVPVCLRDGTPDPRADRALESVNPELAAIIRRALATLPEARYADAGALADDLGRYLDGRRVLAHRYSRTALLLRFVKAWRVPLLISAIALVALGVTVAAAWVRLEDEADRARRAESQTATALVEARSELARALANEAMSRAETGVRHEAELLAAESLAIAPSALARGVFAMFAANPRPVLVDRVPLPACYRHRFDARGERLLCRNDNELSVWTVEPLTRVWHNSLTTRDAIFAGDHVVALGSDRTLSWLKPEDGSLVAEISETECADGLEVFGTLVVASGSNCVTVWPGPHAEHALINPCRLQGATLAFTLYPDRTRWLAACSEGVFTHGSLFEYESLPQNRHPSPLGDDPPLAMAFLDDTTVAAGTADGDIALIDARDMRLLQHMPTGLSKVIDMTILPDQRTLIARAAVGNPVILEPRERLIRGTLPAPPMRALVVFGDMIAYADGDHLMRWKLIAGPTNVLTLDEGIVSTAISRDDQVLAVTTLRGTEFRSLRDGRHIGQTDGSDGGLLKAGIFADDGITWFEAVANRPALRRVILGATTPPSHVPTIDSNRRLASLGSRGILTTNYRGIISVVAPPFDKAVEFAHLTQRVRDMATAPASGRIAVLGDGDSTVWIGAYPNPDLRVLIQRHPTFAVALSSDGRRLALARDQSVEVVDVDTGVIIATLASGERPVLSLAFSHQDQRLAAGTLDGVLNIWDQLADPPMVRIQAHRERISSVTFSHDGRYLVTGSWDQRVRIFGLDDLRSDDQQRLTATRDAWGIRAESR